MNTLAHEFLKAILTAPSPSGFEEPVQNIVRQYVQPFADDVKTDVHGNVIAARFPKGTKNGTGNDIKRVMLAGHCDQIGMLVNYVDDQGFLYITTVGGWDLQNLVGTRVKIWHNKQENPFQPVSRLPIDGVIGKKPIHLLDEEERKKIPKIYDIWIDIGAKDKAEAETLVSVGDPVTVELEYRELLNNLIAAPATDDKAGLWVAMEALRRLDPDKLNVAVYAVATVQEEVGLRGSRTSAFGLDPHIGIATDVTFATDCPTMDKKRNGDVKLGGGPVLSKGPNLTVKLVSALEAVAKQHEIPLQTVAEGKITGTDAGSIQVNRSGVATALISIPNRYMHTPVEVISLKDIDWAADLMARFCESLKPDTDFVP